MNNSKANNSIKIMAAACTLGLVHMTQAIIMSSIEVSDVSKPYISPPDPYGGHMSMDSFTGTTKEATESYSNDNKFIFSSTGKVTKHADKSEVNFTNNAAEAKKIRDQLLYLRIKTYQNTSSEMDDLDPSDESKANEDFLAIEFGQDELEKAASDIGALNQDFEGVYMAGNVVILKSKPIKIDEAVLQTNMGPWIQPVNKYVYIYARLTPGERLNNPLPKDWPGDKITFDHLTDKDIVANVEKERRARAAEQRTNNNVSNSTSTGVNNNRK